MIRETEKGGMAEEIGEVSGRPGENGEEEKRSSYYEKHQKKENNKTIFFLEIHT